MKIDNDFKNLLPELTKEEYTGLERDIVKHGILSPIIVWNDTIVDGHNRYAIAQAHRFPESAIPTKEMKFDSKDQALSWILKHQLGRRNLTDFQRNEIALKYEDIIARQMKERQTEGQERGRDSRYGNSGSGSNDHKPASTTRKELAKIAGTSEGSVQRTKLILEKGTPEQIAQVRKGEMSIGGMVREIKGKQSDATKKTSESKPLEPAEDFLKRSRAEAMATETRTAIGIVSVQAQKITKDRLDGLSEIYKKKELEETINQIRSMIDNCQRAMDLCKSFLEVCCQ